MKNIGRKFSLIVFAMMLPMFFGGCGSTNGGSTTVKTTPTITWATPAPITYGTALSSTQLDATASVAGSYVYNPAAGTVLTAGTQTLSVSFTPTDTTDYNNASSSVTLTVNKATPSITWTPATSVTNEQDLSTVLNATSAVAGTFAYTATISGGTAVAVTSSGVLSTVGNYTITAQFTPSDTTDYNVPAAITATLAVTQAPPVLVSVDKQYVYCEGVGTQCGVQFTLTTADTTATDTLTFRSPSSNNDSVSWSRRSATEAVVNVFYNQYAPGWYTFTICRAGGSSCSSAVATAFLAAQNTLAVSATGELYQMDQTETTVGGGITYYIRKFKANDGALTTDGNFPFATPYLISGISYDNTTNTVDIDGTFDDVNGNRTGGALGLNRSAGLPLGTATRNGYGATTQPSTNEFFGYPISGYPNATIINLGNQPSSLAVGTVGTETDAFVLCRDGAVALWKTSLSSSTTATSVPLTGITPINTVQATNPTAGGWQVVYAETGPAAGTIAVLSTPDAVIDFVNAATMKESSNPATLTNDGIPVQIASDDVHGNFIVAFAHPQTATITASSTTFVRVDPTTGAVTTLTSTSTMFASGFAVSPDGNWLYVCSLSACETQPNQ
jgi:hypothetical protein